jgi:hypothetical protein
LLSEAAAEGRDADQTRSKKEKGTGFWYCGWGG